MSTLLEEIKQKKPFMSLEDQAMVSIIRTAEVLMRKETEFLKDYGITPTQFNVLRILRGAGGNGLMGREISERMVAFDPDVTKLLDRMESRGLVSRERDSGDRRVVKANITNGGLDLLNQVDGPITKYSKKLLGHLGTERIRLLCDLLDEARKKAT